MSLVSKQHWHYIKALLLSLALLMFTPVQGEMTIHGSSNLDTLDYDVDNIHLQLTKLESRWQLSPFDSSLLVEKMRAKRLVITLRDTEKKADKSGLPERINLPFPVQIQQAEVVELVIVTPTETYTLNNVQFDLKADSKTIQLNYLRAATPYGQAQVQLNLQNTRPFALTGEASIKQASLDGSLPYDIKTQLAGDLNSLKFELNPLLILQNNQLAIAQTAANDLIAANMQINGEIGLANDYPLKLYAQLSNLKPEKLGGYPAGLLNIDVDVQGDLGKQTGLQVQMLAKDSYLQTDNAQQTLALAGGFTVLGNQIKALDLNANIASNVFKATGSLGAADSMLEWRADLPQLSTFGREFSGQATANGSLAGTFENLALRLKLAAQKVQLPNKIQLEKLDGQATISADSNGVVDATFNADGLKVAQNPVMNAALSLQGTRAAHQLKLTAASQQKIVPFQFETLLQGGLSGDTWQGFIQSLQLKGETPVTLQAPAKLSATLQDITLGNAVLQLTKGSLEIDGLQAGKKGFVSQGKLSQLALDDIPPSVFTLPAKLKGNPVFSGYWNINAVESVNAQAQFKLDSGDLSLSDSAGVAKPLGLQNLSADLKVVNNQADLAWLLDGKQLGHFDGHVATMLTKVESGFALMANAPLKINSNAQLNTLAWLPLSETLADAQLDGALSMTLSADGTMQKPNLRGNAMGKNLQLVLPSQGVSLTEGTLQANFENDVLLIKEAVWKGGSGYVRTNGTLKMLNQQPNVALDWQAEQFTVLSGADRLLVLNGAGKTTLDNDLLTISGDFKVLKGLVGLPDDDVPTLADDVVVLGRTEIVNDDALKILLNNLRIDLGDDFTLRGRGLDAQLYGAVTLVGLTQYLPHTEGTIRIKKGTYTAYGQVLNITRGVIAFTGPIDNPSLNIRAMRNAPSSNDSIIKSNAETTSNNDAVTGSNFSQTTSSAVQNVNAGVEITGNGLNPAVKLVSEPNVPDTEKLSWLLLGHGTSQAGKNDFAMLSLAAGAVLSDDNSLPLQTKLARAAGLDELSFGGADADTASLTFGKRLSSRLYLSYQKSVSGLLDVARLTFNITPRWALQAETGTESAVDALYTFSFK
ncbi:MAG: translocation/assembly module TamB domain-containing protein [Pseudomonadota bacterium]